MTTLARTLLDISESSDELAFEIALDSAHHGRPFLEPQLDTELARVKQSQFFPGAARLSRLLDVRAGIATESPLETRVRRILRASKLPPPTPQYETSRGPSALRCDGFAWHGRRRQFELDAAHRSRLSAMNWASNVVTHRMLDTDVWLTQLTQRARPAARDALTFTSSA